MRLDRRGALRGLLALWLFPFAGRPARAVAAAPPAESVCVVGRAYLARFPDEADAARLSRALGRAVASRRALRSQVRRDFARGDVVQLQGWVLARSEARRCALEALRQRA